MSGGSSPFTGRVHNKKRVTWGLTRLNPQVNAYWGLSRLGDKLLDTRFGSGRIVTILFVTRSALYTSFRPKPRPDPAG